MSWLAAARTRIGLLFFGAAERRMEEEFKFHVEMETERLVAEGVAPDEARRRALLSFGGVERTREAMRAGRTLSWLSGFHLDVKLGMRMLLKYPVLTVASVLSLTIAITLALSWFQFSRNISTPDIPIPDADRLVVVQNRDLAAGKAEPRSLHEYVEWSAQSKSIQDFTAASNVKYTIVIGDERYATIKGVRTTPSLFTAGRIRPLLGRVLTAADSRPGAPAVAVLGYNAWQRLFSGREDIIGETVRLGAQPVTIVGVMPERFGLPVNEEIWTPLSETAQHVASRAGLPIMMFGRLSEGRSLEEAQAELDAIAQRTPSSGGSEDRLRPQVRRFASGGEMAVAAAAGNLPFIFFLLVVSANVATLLFARTASREGEIALRSALGGSRRRIITQLSIEAFVLTGAAALIALVTVHILLRRVMDLFWEVQQETPVFWFDAGLSASSALYVLALAFAGAVIIGGLPGLRATGRRLRNLLTQPGGGGAGMRFGATATAVIVVQVALCVAFIPYAFMQSRHLLSDQHRSTLAAETFLTAQLSFDADADSTKLQPAYLAGRMEEVRRRIAAEPHVSVVTRSSRLAGFNHPLDAVVVDGDTSVVHEIRQVAIDPNFFTVMEARIAAGRGFTESDVEHESPVVIVAREWAAEVFKGRNPIGRRIRYVERGDGTSEQWYEVVGTVDGANRANGPGEPVALFHPLRSGAAQSLQLYVRSDRPPATLAPRLQTLIAGIDSDLSLIDVMTLQDVWRPVQRSNVVAMSVFTVVSATILLFALIGIYALTSFAVTQRSREIGIRVALGADARRILLSIFGRAALQITCGIVIGAVLIGLAVRNEADGPRTVAIVALSMAVVGLSGCILPAARALRVQPIEVLRAE